MGNECVSALLLNLGTRWTWMVNLCPGRLKPGDKPVNTHCVGVWVGPRTGLNTLRENIYIP
jgi:hypothetical protein